MFLFASACEGFFLGASRWHRRLRFDEILEHNRIEVQEFLNISATVALSPFWRRSIQGINPPVTLGQSLLGSSFITLATRQGCPQTLAPGAHLT
jgi:hypothetical protein